ncbi:SDR family NAD(P)-dependent oxidoreductase [Phycicoccus duodecadis]|uniref:NADP-dependent 3-hydroxy acid dehydrogenase YdfG n=1 Tax=Phycicoccus duodecadis TaxID=173053 RepID=A0A2N3YMP8_9MICO|nr:SDR family oxidoreductase [Phycicoccus duodecadis]PKW28089.1 NADP-dependent 3-hydroxy acid dehydrogenase YdfG [Phycicoccus duodecadis]
MSPDSPQPPRAGGVAVVSGAASGIGAAVVAMLAAHGWRVGGLDLLASAGCDMSVAVDVTDAAAVAAAVEAIRGELGPVDAAVSVAGHYAMAPVSDITLEQWTRMLRVHLGGLRNLSRSVLPAMVDRGAGSIVAITSELAVGGGDGDAHYAAAKGAIIGFVRSLAAEVAPRDVRVNAVAPGPTDTPLLAPDSPWRAAEYLETLPIRRLGSPEEVARCVAWLIEEGTFCVGEILNPNAGAVI